MTPKIRDEKTLLYNNSRILNTVSENRIIILENQVKKDERYFFRIEYKKQLL